MFTGIIETTGSVVELVTTAGGLTLGLDVSGLSAPLAPGESLSVNGVCLSAVRPTPQRCEFDVIQETVRRTNFADLQVGHRVNLERSMSPSSRFDGHFVQGHVDAVGSVRNVERSSREWLMRLAHDPAISPLVVPKGSIAINGVSMTIAEVDGPQFSVALIPTTLEKTNLGKLDVGDRVNLETDIMIRTIHHQLRTILTHSVPEGMLPKLREHGFA